MGRRIVNSKNQINEIVFKESEEGDWQEIFIDGEVFTANHTLYPDDWIELIEKITGIKVIREIIE